MKYCPYCGNQLGDTAAYCTNCGASVTNEPTPVTSAHKTENNFDYGNPQTADFATGSYADPAVEAENKKNGTRAMVYGILAYCLCWIPILGIVFASLARKVSKKVFSNNPTGPAKVLARIGRIIGTISMPFAIYFTIYFTICFVILFLLLLTI